MNYDDVLEKIENLNAESFENDKYKIFAALAHGAEIGKLPPEIITAATLAFMQAANALDLEICDGDEEEFDGAFLRSFFIDCPMDECFDMSEKFLKKKDATLYTLFKKAYEYDYEDDYCPSPNDYYMHAKYIENHDKLIVDFVVSLLKENAQTIRTLLKSPQMPLSAAMRKFAFDLNYVVDQTKIVEELLIPAAIDGDGEACYEVYFYYERGIQPDHDEALIWLERSAESGCPVAQCELGLCLLNEQGDIKKAITYLTSAAEQDNVRALQELGKMYIEGETVERNVDLAVHYFLRAAECGGENSYLDLACIHFTDTFGKKDVRTAARYLRNAVVSIEPQSSEARDCAAKIISAIYERAAKMQTNKSMAVEYYSVASVLGSKTAYAHLNANFPLMTNYIDRIEEIKSLAESGSPEANYFLGCEEHNRQNNRKGSGQNYFDKAIEIWEKRAKAGDAEAQRILGECYLDEYGFRGGRYDTPKALKLLEQAGENGDSRAWCNLGEIYMYGKEYHLKTDCAAAEKYFLLAAKADDAMAYRYLGEIYEKGSVGGARDLKKAMQYYKKSGDLGYTWSYRKLDYIERLEIKNPERAHAWRIKAAENGDRDAQFFLVKQRFANDKEFTAFIETLRYEYEKIGFYDGIVEEIKHKLPHS